VFGTSEDPHIGTFPRQSDLDELCESVEDARHRADVVITSLHCHEGAHDGWNTDVPADFMVTAAHALIDAGAHVVLGHGPHMLRGIEVYKSRPIFYSLGNFFFMLDSTPRVAPESYELYGLDPDASPSDLDHVRNVQPDGRPRGFASDARFWESCVLEIDCSAGRVESVQVHPVSIIREGGRALFGVPALARRDDAGRILDRLAELSKPFGTRIDRVGTSDRLSGRIAL